MISRNYRFCPAGSCDIIDMRDKLKKEELIVKKIRVLCLALVLSALNVPAAAENAAPVRDGLSVAADGRGGLSVAADGRGGLSVVADGRGGLSVVADGEEYPGEVRLIEDTAYVALREFASFADEPAVEWNGETREATVTTADLTLLASPDSRVLSANGRYLWCTREVFADEGVLYVPLRQLALAFGYTCVYEAGPHRVVLERFASAVPPVERAQEDVYWLAKIIEAESGGESFLGKLAVGWVVLNRVASDEFPASVRDVIFDRENGVQFTPTANGAIFGDAGEESALAALICLDNPTASPDALYFINAARASNFWVPNFCTYLFSIGNHDFYR